MRPAFKTWIAAVGAGPLALLCGFMPPQSAVSKQAAGPEVIFTATPVYESLAALHGDERFPQGAQLMMLRAGKAEPLARGFAASADASLSFDAKTVLFAGKKNVADRWEIWEMPIDGEAPRLILSGATDLIRPMWMPNGRFVFARRGPDGFALETAAVDGGDSTRLSYAPGNFVPDDVLRDGRILFESGFPLGAGASPEMYLVYADGSGVESVRCDHADGAENGGREHGRQVASGDVVFTHGRRLARFTSVRAEEVGIAAPAGDYAGDIAEIPDGRWLMAVRRRGEKRYGLQLWRPGSQTMTRLTQDPDLDLVEPVVIAPRPVPNRHPSALHDWTVGNLLALDARQSREGALAGTAVSVRVERAGDGGRPVVAGTAPVERDGSFFVQVRGDRPLHFVLLDAQGKTLRAEQGWFWIRKGEQRICIGCHTGPERAPDNRVPEVLLRSTDPVDVTGGAAAAVHGGH